CYQLDANHYPNKRNESELRALAAEQMDPDRVTDLQVTLTSPGGNTFPVVPARLQSPRFRYTVPATDSLYQFLIPDFNFSGEVPLAVGDGYYAFIPGLLEPGSYTLKFGGMAATFDPNTENPRVETGTFTQEITYKITVTPKP